jgi:hypothetical protein
LSVVIASGGVAVYRVRVNQPMLFRTVGFARERKNMSITSSQKTSLLVGILVIMGGAAFVYFDPLDQDLLGLKQKPAVAQPAAPPHAATPVAKPPAAVPKVAVVPVQAKAPVVATGAAPTPTAAPALTSPAATAKAAVVPVQAKALVAATPVATPPAVAMAQASQPPMKLSKAIKTASMPDRPKNLDLRHCLDLDTDAAIAKCAGE